MSDDAVDVAVSVWDGDDDDSPVHTVYEGVLDERDDHVRIELPRKLARRSDCPRKIDGYEVLATDGEGNWVYDGEVGRSSIKTDMTSVLMILRCDPDGLQ